jgi:hypothetical protein
MMPYMPPCAHISASFTTPSSSTHTVTYIVSDWTCPICETPPARKPTRLRKALRAIADTLYGPHGLFGSTIRETLYTLRNWRE